MNPALSHCIPGAFQTVDEVIAGMELLESMFHERNDRRSVFIGAYLTISRAMDAAIAEGRFADAEWTRRYLISFANLYTQALYAYEIGELDRVPAAWRVPFDLAARNEGSVLQHLMLGVNAHINHDLALALADIGIDPLRERCYRDHSTVNSVLMDAVNALQEHVERRASPILRFLDELCGQWDERISLWFVRKARAQAWEHCLQLVGCQLTEEQEFVRGRIDEHAGRFAEAIARPGRGLDDLLAALGGP